MNEEKFTADCRTVLFREMPKLGLTEDMLLLQRALDEGPPGAGSWLFQPRSQEKWIQLSPDFVLGRNRDCQLQISSSTASQRHCRIDFDEEDWQLIDLDSSNGTRVNGHKVKQRYLCVGDHIEVGGFSFIFYMSEL